MSRTFHRMTKTTLKFRAASVVALALIVVAVASPAAAQSHCTSWVDTLLTYENYPPVVQCVSDPSFDRATDVETFRWKGHEYMIMNRGNELSIYNVDNPSNPMLTAESDFDFGTRGDSDYDLIDFDVCDDCRYGVFSHKVKRTVIFDLGIGGTPTFPDGGYGTYDGLDLDIGGQVFAKGGQEYLVSGTGPGSCVNGFGIYTLNATNDLGFLGCIEIGEGAPLKIKGLHEYATEAATYLFIGGLDSSVHVFRADGVGAGLQLTYITSPAGMKGAHYELSIDPNNALAVSADQWGGEISFWDITNPEAPVQEPWIIADNVNVVSLRSPGPGTVPTLMIHRAGYPGTTRTFTVESSGPMEFEADYWTDPSLPHNDNPVCVFPAGGSLSFDGSVLYLSRYAIHQVFDLSECLAPTPAVADITVTPDPVFPGDTIDVRDTSTGRVDRWALWVEKDGAWQTGETVPAYGNPHEISNFLIPQNVLASTVYDAHILVESDVLQPASPSYDTVINIDRAPQASISISPSAVVVDESVTLTASAEGNPVSYSWLIDPPFKPNFSHSGPSTTVTLDEAGAWNFTLTVTYQHEAAGGGTYQATAAITDFNVTSVAADFTVSPSSPLHTQAITLNGGTSKPVGGNLSYEWTVDGYSGCDPEQSCVIPGETFLPDTWHSVTLKVTNNDDGVFDTETKSMLVGNGSIDPSISFSPASPEIGDNVLFRIDGVVGGIDQARWTMGGSGCDGVSSTQTCNPTLYDECKALAFEYASGGNKTVTLSIDIGNNTFTADPVTVPVASSGSCGGGPPPTCSYTVKPTQAGFGPNGGESAFTVLTTSGCSWTALTTHPWITVTSPKGSVSGSGTVRYRVDANEGTIRSGNIIAGGKSFVVNQDAPWRAANFTMSNPRPEIGEILTLTVDPALEVETWNFGEDDCKGNGSFVNCALLPRGACNTMQWAYSTAGEKAITMALTDGRTQTKGPTVQNKGECCLADGRPEASFLASAEEAFAGQRLDFTDTSSKAFPSKALGISANPPTPEIGETIAFTLTGVVGTIAKATWDFGETGCDGASATYVCEPSIWDECKAASFSFASGGQKPVSVSIELAGGGSAAAGPYTVTVANSGSCGGGGGCSYTLSPTRETFTPSGGSGEFSVVTTTGCDWSATTTSTWVTLGSGEGTGSGTVQYTVGVNPGTNERSAYIYVENRSFKVTQTADKGDIAPTAWQWTVTRVEDEEGNPVDEDVGSGNERNFSHVFALPGRYRVSLVASNCYGSDTEVDYITVADAPIEDFVVGAAVSGVAGANDTNWETDLRFYNPCGEGLDVRIEYLPENVNNVGAELVFREFALLPNETRVFGHVNEAIPGLGEDPASGSVRIESASDSGCKVLSVSRTFNETPEGSLGLFVPALPVKRVGLEYLDLTGLVHNQSYRTNLRLVNYSDEDVWVPLTAYDKAGDPVGIKRSVKVRGQSTKQINAVAEWLSVPGELAPFSIRAEIDGLDVEALATVVDNITGDSVLYLSNFFDEEKIWLAGVASLSGVNESQWRTDLWIYNPTAGWLPGEAEFVVGDNPSDSYGFEWPSLNVQRTKQYLDIVSDELGLAETRGYIVLTGDGGPAPQVAARTYNLDQSGGTYGLNLRAFGSRDLLQPGETGYIAGISNSSDQSVGYRTNVGILNTDRDAWTTVRITMYDIDGIQAAEPYETTIAPGKLRQFDIFKKLGLGQNDMTGSLKIEAVSGGAVAGYATEIDNRTQDSIFIPAQLRFFGPAR